MRLRKKLIEVALPLEAINRASAREKSIRHGHPSTLHLWWARRPLAAARAVIFSQMVDDPSEYVDVLKMDDKLRRRAENELKKRYKVWEEAEAVKARADAAGIESPAPGPEPTLDDIIAEQERERLFNIIEELVLWENTTNETVLDGARAEIQQGWRRTCADNADHPRAAELFDRNKLPAFHDPFAGGGMIPLEAQRLGLETYASDLNPVAVLINKAMIEIPPKFAGMPPVNPEWQSKSGSEKALKVWKGAEGLAEDIRYYGKWMRDEAEKRIGHLYPTVEVTPEMAKERPDLKQYVGKKLTVIAWIWARTVKSPNPAFRDVDVPLASTFMFSTKPGREAYADPIVENGGYKITVKVGKPKDQEASKNGTKLSRGANFQCLMSGTPIGGEYIKSEGKAGRMGTRMLAIVAGGTRGRVYLTPTDEHEEAARKAKPEWRPSVAISGSTQYLGVKPYGMERFDELFTDRQLLVLSTLSDLANDVSAKVRNDAQATSVDKNIEAKITDYANAIATCLSMCVSRQANRSATLNIWDQGGENVQQVFGMQALRMTWDFVEGNPFSSSTGNFNGQAEYFTKVLETSCPASPSGFVLQADAQSQTISAEKVISTDPPYFDNVPYADLSDFF